MEEETCDSSFVARFGWADYTVFACMLVLSAAIGLFYGVFRKGQSTSEFLVGGNKMPIFPMAMSLVSSFMSAIALLGYPAEMYVYGTQFSLYMLAVILFTPFTAYFYLPVYRKLMLTSAFEYLEIRFNRTARLLASAMFLLQTILYMAVAVYAPALALNQVTGMDTYVAVTIMFAVCIFYTSLGGIKAVIWTDTLQTLVMYSSQIAVIIRGSMDVGGGASVWELNEHSGRTEFFNMDPDPTVRHTFWTVVVGGTIFWLSMQVANQAQVQRYLTVPTLEDARKAIWINGVGLVIIVALSCYQGMIIYAKYHDCDPLTANKISTTDQLLPMFVMDTMSDLPGFAGLFVAGAFSASLSTVSTGLNSLATITIKDFISQKKKLTDEKVVTLAKWLSVAYGIIGFALVFVVEQLGAVLQLSISLNGMVSGSAMGMFTLGMFYPWCNSIGAVAGGVVGLVFVFWIGVGTQVATSTGLIVYPQKPVSVEGCLCNASYVTPAPATSEDALPIYNLSYLYYTPLGLVTTVVIGLVVSFFTKPQDPGDVNPDLLSPVAKWFFGCLPSSLREKLGLSALVVECKKSSDSKDNRNESETRQRQGSKENSEENNS